MICVFRYPRLTFPNERYYLIIHTIKYVHDEKCFGESSNSLLHSFPFSPPLPPISPHFIRSLLPLHLFLVIFSSFRSIAKFSESCVAFSSQHSALRISVIQSTNFRFKLFRSLYAFSSSSQSFSFFLTHKI